MSDQKPATAETLFVRLRNIGATDIQGTGDMRDAREAITAYCCEWAVCSRAANKVLTFAAYFACVYGEKLDGTKLRRQVA